MKPAPFGPALLAAACLLPLPARGQGGLEAFKLEFRQALAANDEAQMTALVKTRSTEAAQMVDEACTTVGATPSEEAEREAQALVKAWNAAHGTEFAARYYEYVSLLSPQERRERDRLVAALRRMTGTIEANKSGSRDRAIYEAMAGDLQVLAEGFETLGDSYQAGNCWQYVGLCFDTGYRKEGEVDGPRAAAAFSKALGAWDKAGLRHGPYEEIQGRYARVTTGVAPVAPVGNGGNGGDGGEASGGAPPAAAPEPAGPKVDPAGEPASIAMRFELIEEVDRFARPNYCADQVYQSWPWLAFGAKGGPTVEFPAHKQSGPLLSRVATMDIGIDSDRDGKSETGIKVTGNITPVECWLPAEGGRRPWGFALTTGIAEDFYQRLKYWFEPVDEYFYGFFVGAGSVLGSLGETELRVIDENCDGIYGSPPLSWMYHGLTEGFYHFELDSLVIGDSERAVPWSEYVQVPAREGRWYRLESLKGGMELYATPVLPETGRLKLDYEGPPVSWLVVRGEGVYGNCYYDLMADPKNGVEVPAGSYALFEGEVRKGKKQQTQKALILPPGSQLRWTVEPGKTTTVELGGPFGFDFKTARTSDGVVVIGKSVVVTGARGERYERPWNCVAHPEAAVRKQGDKKGAAPIALDHVLDLEALDDEGKMAYDLIDAWFPLDTLLPFVGDAFEVQLTERRHPLFGKVESEWK
jgi:hypothetical protein